MNNIVDVIARFGGGTKLAAILGIKPQAVCNMKAKGTFPPRHWPALIAEARRKGLDREITWEFLASLTPHKKSRSQKRGTHQHGAAA